MHEDPTTNEQILYAQALQIAILLSGDKQNFLVTDYPNDLLVEKHLEKYRPLAKSILRSL